MQIGEHQISPLPFEQVTIAEQALVIVFAFGLGDKPGSGSHRIEVFDEDFGIETFLFLCMPCHSLLAKGRKKNHSLNIFSYEENA